jgi:Domain of unknown function (DUF6915)
MPPSRARHVRVRDVAEQHVPGNVGWAPSLSDWLREMPAQPWMAGARKLPIKIVD